VNVWGNDFNTGRWGVDKAQVMYRKPDKLLVLQRMYCCSLAQTYTNTNINIHIIAILKKDQ